ncbi:OsmC family protein [Neptunomonas sp.]|uniref:OsmC family protein n=1 Tax=Neptunomonas sp. TaxID=1971898 RepID=UPI0025EE2A5A|nr:OsmC family protein [Neptunomonas sp.]
MSVTKTVRVEAEMGDSFRVQSDIRGHKVIIDQPAAGGGTDEGPTPLEYFLFSLAGCVATIGRVAAKQQKIELHSFSVSVEADYDPAGLLGKPTDNRSGFQVVRVTAEIDAQLSSTEKQAFLDEVCDRCPLHDNIKLATEVVHTLAE